MVRYTPIDLCKMDTPLPIYIEFHRKELRNFLMNLYEWNGLPKTIEERFFNDQVLFKGYCTAFKYVDKQIYCTNGAISGLDRYYRPTNFTASNIYFKNLKREIGKDCVVCYNTLNYQHPEEDNCCALIDITAYRLAELDLSLDTSVKNSRVCLIPVVGDEKEAIRTAEVIKKMYEGKPAVLAFKTAFNKEVQMFPIKARDNIVVSELADARRNIMADFYSYLGIDTIAVDKKERTNYKEMESNKTQLLINGLRLTEAREIFCKEMNEMFGTNISVRLRKETLDQEVLEDVESRTETTTDTKSET